MDFNCSSPQPNCCSYQAKTSNPIIHKLIFTTQHFTNPIHHKPHNPITH